MTINPYTIPGIPTKTKRSEKIKEVVCDYFGISFDELLKNREDRHPKYLRPRQFVMYFMRKQGFTLIEIGFVFQKNHATVLSAIKNIESWIETDKEIRKQFTELNQLINQN